ncbi:MAG: methyltransferase domain-containing protein [Clostridiaceae bacterium]|nr:methyltransferase domain-containing protein [Eubacteriales bacterium]
MAQSCETVKKFYDEGVKVEWGRLERHRFEFDINRHFIAEYVKPGDKVLDCGGGPGRYSLWLAERGCDVTLFDLSTGNVAFAREKARGLGLPLRALAGDARDLSALESERFDHILLMGPMYHLLEEADRVAALNACLTLLKRGGTLSVSFISSYAGILYYLREMPEAILDPAVQSDYKYMEDDLPYSGMAFTDAYFIRQQDVRPFMERFPLKTLRFLSSEGIYSPWYTSLQAQSEEVYQTYLKFALATCERENLLSFAEHFLYIGRKCE